MTRAAHRREQPVASHKRLAVGVARRRKVRTAGGKIGQWWSPPWLADLFVAWAGARPGMRVLDAGAGRGALSLAALAHGADVACVESDRRYAEVLERELGHRARVVHADFLTHAHLPPADVILSNPPWEDDFPERFLARALTVAPRVCAILPINVLCGVGRAEFWQQQPIRITRARALARRPRFLGAKGGMRDVVFLEARARASLGPQRLALEVGDA